MKKQPIEKLNALTKSMDHLRKAITALSDDVSFLDNVESLERELGYLLQRADKLIGATYNGWKNHSTWSAFTIISNTEALYTLSRTILIESENESDLANRLKSNFDGISDADVDWAEIAEEIWLNDR